MPKEINIINRLGNKEQDIKFFNELLPENIKNIVEPFGGSFAVIRKKYNDKKYKKFVNDTDPALIKVYNDPENYIAIKNDINSICKKHLNDNGNVVYTAFIKELTDLKIDSDLKEYWKKSFIVRGRTVTYRKKNEHNYDNQLALFKNIYFSCEDWENYTKKHAKKNNTFIFLDPPYLFSDNSSYTAQSSNCDCTDMIYKIYEIFINPATKAKIMLVINDMKIIRYFFKDFIKKTYDKIYSIGKRKETHLVICNY